MATKLEDPNTRSNNSGVYDDGTPSWYKPDDIDKLEKKMKAPAASDDNLPDGHPSKSSQGKSSGDEEKETLGSTDTKKSKKGPLAKIGGKKGLAGILFGAIFGGGFALFGLMSGPLQMLQFSNLLQNTHFSPNEMFGRSRTGKLLRYAVTADTPDRRNMRFLGNRVADRYQSRLRQSGIELDFAGSRTLRSVRVNPNTVNGQDFIRRLQANGVNVDVPPGATTVEIPLEGRGRASQARGVLNASVDTLNLNRASSAVGKRLLKVRGNVNFKPLRNTARESGENIRSYFRNRNQDVADARRAGVDTPTTRVQGDVTEGAADDPQARNAADTINTTDDIVDTTRNDLGAGRQVMRNVNRGAGVAGLMCLAKGIYDARDAITYLNIVLPLMRIGVEFASVGDQIRSGDDFSMDEVARVHDLMYDEEEENSVFSADAVRAAMGEEPTGHRMPDVAKPGQIGEQPALIKAIDAVPAMDGVCSRAGQLVLAVVGGPINIAFEALLTGLSAVNANPLDYAIDWIARALAGEEIDGVPKGALLGNYAMYGARIASNDSFIAMGARELGPEEEQEVALAAQNMLREQQMQKSFAQRVFDVQDVNSLASRALIASYGVKEQGISSVKNLANLPSLLIRNIFGVMQFQGSAYANSVSYDYGFPRFGFSMNEIEDLDESFDPFDNADWIETGDRLKNLNDRYGECFNTTINPNNGRVVTNDEGALNYYEIDSDLCSDAENEELLRYRLYLADMITTKSLACLEMISTEACEDIGVSAGRRQAGATPSSLIVGDPYSDGADVDCDPRTRDLGVFEGYTGGRQFDIRLCSLPNLPSSGPADNTGNRWTTSGADGHAIVNSRVSGAWYSLVEEAGADGVDLRAMSTFRSNPHQESLWSPGSTSVARPGYSSHQAGVAIDFANMSYGEGAQYGRTCSNPMTADTDAHRWMRRNAYRFGFKQLSFESWHWDALPLENRCDYQ